ncbi:hypothetical protein FE257_001464 [Aspergillus nanangensis]|uniref:Zn(2)-C6 fungal-type domain-containing protein n=1 Tax=Aspergillus nanangensis TaxID=2582783 RepID=A0AAD4CDP1_ASPNN|nr:hypothetical protein FE257_001464 [Aspergillus nanangensis]
MPTNPRSTPHSKTGCLTCRRRKKKCDERHPTCTACHRNALDCVWPTAETAARPRRPRRRQIVVAGSRLPAELSAMMTVFALPSPGLVRRLLHHFTQHGPMWLTSRSRNSRTAILFDLFPEAMESPLVLNCVLMTAAEDLLKYDSSMELQAAAIDYYGEAIAGLRGALASEPDGDDLTSDQTLLAVALFCLHEAQNYSDSNRLIPHLNGAAILLRRRLHTIPPNLSLRKFLFEMFCYFFSIAAFTHGPSLAFTDSSHIFDFPGLDEYLHTGTIMGTSQTAFPIIFRLSRYLSESSTETSIRAAPNLHFDLIRTAQDLQDLRPSFQISPDMTTESINDGVTFELYRLAYLIYLNQVIGPGILTDVPLLPEMVTSFIRYLAQLPAESPSDGFLCWPLVVVGLHALDRTHQMAVAQKLKAIHHRFRSEIFSRNLAFLRRWWREGQSLGQVPLGSEYPVVLV